MRGVEVGLRVVEFVEAFEFVSDPFDLETALVPGMKDATCAPFPDCIAKIVSSPLVGVGVGVGVEVRVVVGWVGMISVRVVGWRVANELVNEELFGG